MLKKIIQTTLLVTIFLTEIVGQTHQLNHQKYWYYRYRLINHFTKIGTEPGESLIFSIRGEDEPFYNSDYSNMLMGDQTITMGQYMAVLALEYNMLAQNNQNTDQTVKELWHILYAFNRLDLNAESMFRPNVNGGYIRGPAHSQVI